MLYPVRAEGLGKYDMKTLLCPDRSSSQMHSNQTKSQMKSSMGGGSNYRKRRWIQKSFWLNKRNPTNSNAQNLKNGQTNTYQKEQLEYIQSQIDKIKNMIENRQSRITWQAVNEVSGRKSIWKAKLSAANQEERLQKRKEHFKEYLGNSLEVTY